MKEHVSLPVKVATGVLVSVVVGCGGGGGGYGSSNPAPSVSISQQAASINFGQSATVTWTSVYTTSCTASASNAAAGSFTGTQMVNGSQVVVPTAPGSYTYTLSCTGAGGTMQASTTVTVTPNLLAALAPVPLVTIGSTVPATGTAAGDQNPYGLVIAPATAGLITKGDLIVCNFNNATPEPGGTQGQGTTIIGLHPTAGSTLYPIAQSTANLLGCSSLAMLPDDSMSATAWTAMQVPLVSATGTSVTPFPNAPVNPWSQAYVAATSTQPAAIYVSNAPAGATINANGTIDRISLAAGADTETAVTEIVTGFCTSGVPGALFGPAGLTYDATSDTLYVVDTSSASVIAITGVSAITATDAVVVTGQCTGTTPTAVPTFTGPSASSARVIAHGAPFNAPLSAALLKNGDLVVANADIGITTASATTNLLIEVSPVVPGGFVGQPVQLDATTPGALFGLAATVDAAGNQVIYFNDDNAAQVMQLGPVPTTMGNSNPYTVFQ